MKFFYLVDQTFTFCDSESGFTQEIMQELGRAAVLLNSSTPGRRKALNLLMIEDDTDLTDMLEALFEKHLPESQTTAVDTGEGGLSLLDQRDHDVVLLDLGLPDIDGFEVLRRIRRWR